MPGASSSGCRRGRTGRVSVRMHVDFANTMFIVQPGRPEHDHELALARVRRFHVDAENARARRCVDAKHFRLRRAAFEPNLHVCLRSAP